ncbi:MAG: acetyl-CoA hydrolase, partial [Proteobacteria bacterium]|nr:acetyl-CoA hydrolase [Pseudomonadota bacterium]
MTSRYWTDYYVENRRNAQDAVKMIKSGQRVFISSYCSEPQHLIEELGRKAKTFTDIEIVRLFSNESTPLSEMARESSAQNFNIRSFYLGSAKSKTFENNRRFITPINLSDIPRLFNQKLLPIHVALIQVTPPDDFGWMSLG